MLSAGPPLLGPSSEGDKRRGLGQRPTSQAISRFLSRHSLQHAGTGNGKPITERGESSLNYCEHAQSTRSYLVTNFRIWSKPGANLEPHLRVDTGRQLMKDPAIDLAGFDNGLEGLELGFVRKGFPLGSLSLNRW